jgi:hypothetical protein
VTQFIKGLKPEIQNVVQVHLPITVDKAVLLVQMQQEVLEKNKIKTARAPFVGRQQTYTIKQDHKGGDLSKERQL